MKRQIELNSRLDKYEIQRRQEEKGRERAASINFPSYYSSIRKKAAARARGNYDLQAIKQLVQ